MIHIKRMLNISITLLASSRKLRSGEDTHDFADYMQVLGNLQIASRLHMDFLS